ncbi:MAG: site-specific integrase, partial [Alphaproteobacteria bacterium]|nr:site-specific integrase [Alphaproteobacteria bacterium]
MPETPGKGSADSSLVPVSPTPLVELVLDSLASGHSRRAYGRALGEFFAWYLPNASGEGFTWAVLGRYRSHLIERGLSAASVNLALAALRKLASEAAAHGGLSPLAAAGIRGVSGARCSGVRTGNWLTLPQAQRLLAAPNPETIKGLRDRVLLGLLVGCGGGSWRGWSLPTSLNVRAAGRSSISSASTAASAPSRCRPGPG